MSVNGKVQRGAFLTLEGIEGVGKSTNVPYIRERLQVAGRDVLVTREPGGTPLAEAIRELLLVPRDEPVEADAELLLMVAARVQHVRRRIEPALQQGTWVLCDRFVDSTFAYQGAGRELERDHIHQLHELVLGGVTPDLTLLFDAPVDICLQRAGGRSAADRFEAEDHAFFHRVRSRFLAEAERAEKRICVIDAARPPEEVRRDIDAAVDGLLVRFAGRSESGNGQ